MMPKRKNRTGDAEVGAFHRLLSSWLGEHLPVRVRASARTVGSYRQSMKQYAAWLRDVRGVRFDEVTFDHLSRDLVYGFLCWLRDERGLRAATINLRLSTIKSFLKYCGEEDLELAGAYLRVKSIHQFEDEGRPAAETVEYLTEPQVRALLSAPDAGTRLGRRDRFVLGVAYEAGLRVQELVDLTVGCVEREGGRTRLRVRGKGDKVRHVPLPSEFVPHLDAYLSEFHPGEPDPAEWLVYTVHRKRRTQMSTSTVDYVVKKHARAAHEADPSFPESTHEHVLRHSIATAMYRAKVPLPYIRDFLGHANLTTTMVYAHACEDGLAEAIEAASVVADESVAEEEPRWKGREQYLMELCTLA